MITIIGAGIAGLSLGAELVSRGAKVRVLEAGLIASGASGVATSYLEARLGDTAMRRIEQDSMRRWPDFAGFLSQETGIDIGFNTNGQIRVSLEENAARFDKDLTARIDQGWEVIPLTPAELLNKEPALSPDLARGVFLPNVRWVTGKFVCHALAQFIRNAGGTISENSAVTAIKDNTVCLLDGTEISSEKLIFCTGLGADKIAGLPSDLPLSRPVRGVNLLLGMGGSKTPIKHLIKHHRGNICPRTDATYGNHLIVGTTHEADETSREPDSTVIEELYANALPIIPSLRELPLLGVTVGLRSKIGDGLLRLGRSAHAPNIYYSLSHAGAGFLRAPVIADEFAEFILTGNRGKLTEQFIKG